MQVTTQPRSECHLAARLEAMAWKALVLLGRGLLAILAGFVCLWVGAAALAVASAIVIGLGYASVLIAQWAFKWIRSCFRGPTLPPVVEMASPVKAGEAAAEECNLLLGGGTHVPRPSGLPVEQQ